KRIVQTVLNNPLAATFLLHHRCRKCRVVYKEMVLGTYIRLMTLKGGSRAIGVQENGGSCLLDADR
ncbi:hypothetical protein, partial [Caballeronia glebae]|uniref:hypothetical protein n=1 Tax=Caballeronia glebae TaxID=1777143 RepID=UPI0038B8B706